MLKGFLEFCRIVNTSMYHDYYKPDPAKPLHVTDQQKRSLFDRTFHKEGTQTVEKYKSHYAYVDNWTGSRYVGTTNPYYDPKGAESKSMDSIIRIDTASGEWKPL